MSILYACVLGHRDRRYGVFGPLICAAFLTACDAAKTRAPDARSPRESTAPLQEPIVEKRAHWAAFERRLPADPLAAASALEHYRRANGLPFDFTVALDSTSGRARGLHVTEDDMGAGAYVTAFVRQMPDSTSALVTSTVYEFDEKGRVVREWAIPRDVEFWYVVEGVVGDELVTAYRTVSANVHLYFRPNGTYRVSADSPPTLERERWIEVGDSTWLLVNGAAIGERSRHADGHGLADPGRWMASTDSGWYVRLDTVPGLPVRVRATSINEPAMPPSAPCPVGRRFEGLICSYFPTPGGRRRLGYPTPLT